MKPVVTYPQIARHPVLAAWFPVGGSRATGINYGVTGGVHPDKIPADYDYLYSSYTLGSRRISTHKDQPGDAPRYRFFFHIYKPTTPSKKASPPPSHFGLAVIHTRTTPMPTLHELDALFEAMPELPPPLPR
ncbi:hypothetical protein ONZ45_g7522 [Pleurotus djamor]|nr:hypothetical protein ONZ45_g7522 [Pleurotus djamor]